MFDTLGCLLVEASEATSPGSARSAAGPPTAGPSTAGPSTAEPSTAEPSTAEPSTAEPSTAEPSTAEPSTAGPSTALGRSVSGGAADSRVGSPIRRTFLPTRPLASRSLGGKPLVDWVLRRASEAQQLQAVVVILPSDSGLESFRSTLPSGVEVFESDRRDSLGRLCDCLEHFPAKGIVNLRLDCPLLDPCLIDRLIHSVGSGGDVDYATFRSVARSDETRLQAILNARLGLFAEYFRAEILRKLDRLLTNSQQRQDFSAYLWSHPEEFALRLASLPPELDRDDLRLSLRHPDDWDHAEQIVDALGDDGLDWQRIVALLQRQPSLRRRMADLNHADMKNLDAPSRE